MQNNKASVGSILSAGAMFISLVCGLPAPARAGASKPNGTFYVRIATDPSSLNPITSVDGYSSEVYGNVLDSLLNRDDDTYAWIPCLAEKWEISKDGKVFTFRIRDGVKWSDGQPLTVEDVKYSFDVYHEGRFKTSHSLYYQDIKEVKIVDPHTVQFITKEPYFKNFEVAAGLPIIPKHFYGVGDPEDPKFNRELIGTGPYMLAEWNKGQHLILKRNPNFWGDNLPYYRERNNFSRIFFRPVGDESVSLELLKKGDIDFLGLSPEQYVQKTKGPEWGQKVIAVKAENSSSANFMYGFIGWNQANPIFKDRDTRVALSHLINRDFMIEKFEFGMAEKATGPFGNKSPASSPKVKPIDYDPKQAMALLKKAGWSMGPSGLVKTIDGKQTPFEFTLLTADPNHERYSTVIKEDMKKVGITMNLKLVEWNSFIKLLNEHKFDAVKLAWSVPMEQDPKSIFHSASIAAPGNNFVGYSNPKVDSLIDKLRVTMDEKKRRALYHQVHELIAADQPYSFLFNRKYSLYAHTKRIKKLKDTFRYTIGDATWRIEAQ